jgi:hypothetical protein
MTDTRWEECKKDLYSADTSHPFNSHVDQIIDKLKDKGWRIIYPDNWPDLCPGCRNHIEEGTYHVTFKGNQWGACEIVKGPPRGMVPRNYSDENGNFPLVPYWGDPKPKSV